MSAPQEPEVRQQLAKILSSSKFKDGGRSRRFLEFIVDETLAGKRGDLKENIVGIHVFDRGADYDPRLDSIVRVEAGRLRTKLAEYYDQEGREDGVAIVLPKGSYAPQFTARDSRADVAQIDQTESHSRSMAPSRIKWVASMAALLAIGGVALFIWLNRETVPQVRIAVLPFSHYSGDEKHRLLAAQLTDRVTTELVKLEKLSVVPSTSARQYDDRRPGVREIATALQADILIEGRTTVEANEVKVEIRLSEGAKDRKFWVEDRFVGDDIDDLARDIAAASSKAIDARKK